METKDLKENIRKVLVVEITSKLKSVERLYEDGAFDAAAREDAVKEGLHWALFVLSVKCGI
jgi:hypothetical protein